MQWTLGELMGRHLITPWVAGRTKDPHPLQFLILTDFPG